MQWQILPKCDQHGVVLIWCQKTWLPPNRSPCHTKLTLQNILNSQSLYNNRSHGLVFSQKPLIHQCVLKTFNVLPRSFNTFFCRYVITIPNFAYSQERSLVVIVELLFENMFCKQIAHEDATRRKHCMSENITCRGSSGEKVRRSEA